MKEQIHKAVYDFKTKHSEGFTTSEINELLLNYPDINKDKFYDALQGITGMFKDNDTIIYHCDIEKALLCGIQNRDLYNYEFD